MPKGADMWIDIGIGVWLFITLVWGIRYGLVRTVFGLGGLVAGVALAGAYSKELAGIIPLDEKIAGVIAFIIIFIVVFIAAVILGRVLYKLLHWASLGWIDYLGGAVLGLLVGGVVAGAALTAVLRYFPESATAINASQLGRFLAENFPQILQVLPEEFRGLLPGD
jgi:membrane protein required for colicin V production